MHRFVGFVLAATAASATLIVSGITPAAAHVCPIPAQIPIGTAATISVGVTVEDAVVTDVTIGIPAGLQLDRVDNKAGWSATRHGSTVRYRGGSIAAFTCEYFSLGVTATTRGAFGISVTQRTADGKVVARTTPDASRQGDQVFDQFVYAGVQPPSSPSSSNGLSTTTVAGIALVAVGVVMFAVLAIRARRRRGGDDDDDRDDGASTEDTRETELLERLDRFKQQTMDRPKE